jgi:uncharacterized protein YecE (DUF72 family)
VAVHPHLVQFAISFLAANADAEVLEILAESMDTPVDAAEVSLREAVNTTNDEFFVVVLPEREYESYLAWYDSDK